MREINSRELLKNPAEATVCVLPCSIVRGVRHVVGPRVPGELFVRAIEENNGDCLKKKKKKNDNLRVHFGGVVGRAVQRDGATAIGVGLDVWKRNPLVHGHCRGAWA